MEVVRNRKSGIECILIGHSGHPEVEGTMGQARDGVYLVETLEDVARLEVKNPSEITYVTQTTLSVDDTARIVDALRTRFPKLTGPKKDDICYATQNRQDAVKRLSQRVDVMLVVGSANSSNSSRLREVSEKMGARSYMVDGPDALRRAWFTNVASVGLTAGASAPELLVKKVVDRLRQWGAEVSEERSIVSEHVYFALPKALRPAAASEEDS